VLLIVDRQMTLAGFVDVGKIRVRELLSILLA
jgi:hypothetical protein